MQFLGNTDVITRDLPLLHLERCTDKGIQCKTQEEIDTFLQDKQLIVAMKDNRFDRENYVDGETIQSITRFQ